MKKTILLDLGWNHTIKNQILSISKHERLELIEKSYSALESKLSRLELDNKLETTRVLDEINSIRLQRCTVVDGIRTQMITKYFTQP